MQTNGGRPARLRPPGRRTGWRYEQLLLLLAALTALVTLGVQLSGRFKHAPVGLPIALYSVAAVLAVATLLVKSSSETLKEDVKWAQEVRDLLKYHPGPDRQLPRLSTFSPYKLGASPSDYGDDERRGSDPYVPREIDKKLDAALREKSFILIIGEAKAGKSRTAYEAARRLTRDGVPHDPTVLVPKGTAAVGKILDLDPPLAWPKPALLWLDDLTEGELADPSIDVLNRLANQVIVLGTITVQRYARISDSDSLIGRNAREVLKLAYKVRLERRLTDDELTEAYARYPDEEFDAGIGEQLVAARVLLDRYDNDRQGAEPHGPHGWAIVQTAIDWVRMDVGRPVRQSELATLYPLYLAVERPNDEPQSDLTALLEWACRPVGSRLALLQRRHSDDAEPSFLPFDYLVDVADGQGDRPPEPIPDWAWDQLPSLTTPEEVLRAADSAYVRNVPKPSMRLFQAAIDTGHRESAGKAALYLGVLLAEQGDVAGAQDAYRQAIDIGDPQAAGGAAVILGRLLHKQQGDIAGAKDAYRQAIDVGHPESAPSAALSLGELLEDEGDVAGALDAYRQALDIRDPKGAGRAAYKLGRLLKKEGDIAGAQAHLEQAIKSASPGDAFWAGFSLAGLLREQGVIPTDDISDYLLRLTNERGDISDARDT